jgi:hypothetical protein
MAMSSSQLLQRKQRILMSPTSLDSAIRRMVLADRRAQRRALIMAVAVALCCMTACSDSNGGSGDKTLSDIPESDFNTGCTGTQCADTLDEDADRVVIKDADRDGIPDHIEDRNFNGVFDAEEGETDWQNPDTDDDGLLDGIEDANRDGVFGEGETDPRNPDTDDDGLLDGIEDGDRDGVHSAFKGETDPRIADTDDDGLSDLIEYQSNYGRDRKTDPNNPDTDADGLLDGGEDANQNGQLDAGETSPLERDTDGDGVSDGCEDINADGVVDANETDPLKLDTDGDGLRDGGFGGECVNQLPGQCPNFDEVTQCPTNPTLSDTDSDGLSDAVEVFSDYQGLSSNPRNPDTDGDGLLDGEEDFNRNGIFNIELGELNPTIPSTYDAVPDDQRPQADACSPIGAPAILSDEAANLQLALPPELQTSPLSFGVADENNRMGWTIDHPSFPFSGFVLSKRPDIGTDSLRQARADGARLADLGAEIFFEQTFNTWDGYVARLTTYRFEQTDNTRIRATRDDLVARLMGVSLSAVSGLPPDLSSSARKVQLTVLTVRRSSQQVLVIGAVVPNDSPPNDILNIYTDGLTYGGTLAAFTDVLATDDRGAPLNACDVFRIGNLPIVDFLFIVDDTNSMRPYQQTLVRTTNEIFSTVRNAFISARWTIASTDVGPQTTGRGDQTQCGLTASPKGPDNSIWATFDASEENDFRCRVRDPIGSQNCDPTSVELPGFAEYGLLCSRWAIDYIQGRRADAPFKNQQRPRSALIVIVLSDEADNLLSFPADLDNGDAITPTERDEALAWLGADTWSEVDGQVVASRFIPYYRDEVTKGPFNSMTPFFIYSKNDANFRGGYYDVMDAIPDTFPQGGSFDIRRCRDNPNCTEITEFIQRIVRVANALASPLTPRFVPITLGMRVVIQRGFSETNTQLVQSGADGWLYDPVNRTILFFGPSRPQLLDAFAISYLYWTKPE